MSADQFGQFAPGTIWENRDGRRFMVRDDGRWVSFPSMWLLAFEPPRDDLARCHVVGPSDLPAC